MFKLAGHLGRTVRELECHMSANELDEWIAYDQLDPIGGYRTDLGFALLAYLQAGDKNSKINDFLIVDPNPVTAEEKERREREREVQQAREQVQMLIARFNKIDRE